MRGKSVALLVLALGCGLVASLGITQVMARRGGDTAAPSETQALLLAAKDIPANTAINLKEHVKSEEWPKTKIPAGAIFRLEDLEGRRSKMTIFADEPIREEKLQGKGPADQWADVLIKKGYRVASVKVTPEAIHGGLLRPGSRVDLLVNAQGNNVVQPISKIVLQDVRVFAVNDVVSVESGQNNNEPKSIQGRTVSLLVTPAQAELVTAAGEMGSIRLILRHPEDDVQTAPTRGVSPSDVLGAHEGANREKENEGAEKDEGFLARLKKIRDQMSAAAKSARPVAPVIEPLRWPMRVLRGSDVTDVVLEGKGPPAAPAEDGGWKINGLGLTAVGTPASGTAEGKQPRAPPKPPAKTDTPSPGKTDTKPGQDGPRPPVRV